MNIDSLELKPRTHSTLVRLELTEVEQLKAMSDEELVALDGIGAATVEEIRAAIAALPQSPSEDEQPEQETEPVTPALTLGQIEVGQNFRFVDMVDVLRDRRPDDIYQRMPSERPVGVEVMNLRSGDVQPLATFNEAQVELVEG